MIMKSSCVKSGLVRWIDEAMHITLRLISGSSQTKVEKHCLQIQQLVLHFSCFNFAVR